MNSESKHFYVYSYRRRDGTVAYIGKGCKGRAWHCGYMRGDTQERQNWKNEQLEQGRLPCDWVKIEARGLTQKEALAFEKEMIALHKPQLNCFGNPDHEHSKFWTKELEGLAIVLKLAGLSYSKIAKLFKVSTMTIHRRINEYV